MALISVGFYPSLSSANAQVKLNSAIPATLLVMGDSLSAAYGLETSQGWVSLLQQKVLAANVEVVNASISGETTSGGKQRLPALLKQYQPRVLIIELGANDALRGQNLKVTQQNLQAMIAACQPAQFNCKVVLLGIRLPTNYGPAYDLQLQQMYRTLAAVNADNGILFDAFFLESVALEPDLMQFDGLHPNSQAQPLILQRVWPLIEQALSDKIIP